MLEARTATESPRYLRPQSNQISPQVPGTKGCFEFSAVTPLQSTKRDGTAVRLGKGCSGVYFRGSTAAVRVAGQLRMRWVLWVGIRAYWLSAGSWSRARPPFRVSCSRIVYDTTRAGGRLAGLQSLRERWRRCPLGHGVECAQESVHLRSCGRTVVGPEDVDEAALAPHRNSRSRERVAIASGEVGSC